MPTLEGKMSIFEGFFSPCLKGECYTNGSICSYFKGKYMFSHLKGIYPYLKGEKCPYLKG